MSMYKWRPSKSKAREFAKQMDDINDFCADNGIQKSLSSDSYYFCLDGIAYRVSNHSIEASNRAAFDDFGQQIREKYHDNGRDPETVYIHASKTRIIEIYNNLKSGKKLDGRGNVVQ